MGRAPTRTLRKKLRSRDAIEPAIGHLKHDHRMGRSELKGRLGDPLNALGATLGFNFRKLLAGFQADAAHAAFAAWMNAWIGSKEPKPVRIAA